MNRMLIFTFLTFILLFSTNCYKTYDINTRQGDYKIIKANFKTEQCQLEYINFQQTENGIFIDNDEFTKLTNNINNWKFCYQNLYNRANAFINYYENIIKTLGGKFV